VVRRGKAIVSSLMEGWKLWNRVLEGGSWSYTKWHYLVPSGCQAYAQRPLEEICALQWIESNRLAREDLDRLVPDRYLPDRHEDLLADPAGNYGRILEFCELRDSPYFRSVVERANEKEYTLGAEEGEVAVSASGGDRADLERLEPINRLYYG
jgi:hypothetical protein